MSKRKKKPVDQEKKALQEYCRDEVQYGVDIVHKELEGIKSRLDLLEVNAMPLGTPPATPEDDWFWVSMDKNGSCHRWDKRMTSIGWCAKSYQFVFESGKETWLKDETVLWTLDTAPPGLQPGMRCKAKRVAGIHAIYEIFEVVKCHLPIEVELQDCEHYRDMLHGGCPLNYTADCLGRQPHRRGWGCKVRCLPNTDIAITCEFEEKRIERLQRTVSEIMIEAIQTKEQPKLIRTNCPVCGHETLSEARQEQPKLITLDVLKSRGLTCKEPLQLFKLFFPDGCSYKELQTTLSKLAYCFKNKAVQYRVWSDWVLSKLGYYEK